MQSGLDSPKHEVPALHSLRREVEWEVGSAKRHSSRTAVIKSL